MARPETIRLHADIRKEYERMSNIKEHGVSKFSLEYILAAIAIKYYKSPKTIENIVFNRTTASYPSMQASLFSLG